MWYTRVAELCHLNHSDVILNRKRMNNFDNQMRGVCRLKEEKKMLSKFQKEKEIVMFKRLSCGGTRRTKNEERRNEGNRYKRNHDDQGVTPPWYKRIIKTRGYEQKSEYGIPWWYKREVKIEHTDNDLRSEDRSTGMTGNEEKTEKRRNKACVMHYNERKQTRCCTTCKYCGKPVVKLC